LSIYQKLSLYAKFWTTANHYKAIVLSCLNLSPLQLYGYESNESRLFVVVNNAGGCVSKWGRR